MRKITALRVGRGRRKRVNVFLDGRFAFSLEAEVVIREGLKVGQELSANQIEALARSDHFYRCLNAAGHYLSYRPRSEAEVRERLQRRGFDGDRVDTVIAKLKEQGLVDDMAFAQFWKDNRQSFSPRSQWLTKLELRQKGIADDIIDRVVDAVDDEDSAYRAAVSKARSLPQSDYQGFRRRLGEYLKRRGFGYGVIKHTVERVWQERGNRSG
ncbi:MAG: RecX family transcriptional regulator [Dehalococcoidales bacterium]|nr:RecX family transcriptional regulator [Dehalococcoidales bacterium]